MVGSRLDGDGLRGLSAGLSSGTAEEARPSEQKPPPPQATGEKGAKQQSVKWQREKNAVYEAGEVIGFSA
jgi:hypothetical protein